MTKNYILLFFFILITACGGGGGSEPDPASSLPPIHPPSPPPTELYVGGTGQYSSIQNAVDAAATGIPVRILISKGIFQEKVIIRGTKNLIIQGGWEEDFSSRTNDPLGTILDGSATGRVFEVSAQSGQIANVSIEGVTLRNGYAERGAGLLAYAQGGTVLINLESVKVASNRTNATDLYDGGGVYANTDGSTSYVRMELQKTILENNHARCGGALAANSHNQGRTEVYISRSTIIGNTASDHSGGLWFNSNLSGSETMVFLSENIISDNTGPTVNAGALGAYSSNGGWTSISMKGNSVLRNQAAFGGGLVFYGWGSGGKLDVELTNNLIAQNIGTKMFGGISFNVDRGTAGTIEISNNTVAANWAGDTAGGIFVSSDGLYSSATCMLRNNIVWGNTCKLPNQSGISLYSGYSTLKVEALYNIFESVLIGGPVNYIPNNTEQVDPLFIDFQNGDYRLSENSPAIDRGDPAEIHRDASIPPGQGTERGDLGAYGGPMNILICGAGGGCDRPPPPTELYVGGTGQYSSIQDAVDAAATGLPVHILISKGIFQERVIIRGTKNLIIQGGWEEDFSSRTNDPLETILDGSATGRVFEVSARSGQMVNVSIEGMTLQNGYAERGAGLLAYAQGGTVLINLESVKFANNSTNETEPFDGGGIYANADGNKSFVRMELEEVILENNHARSGGAIAVNSHDQGQIEVYISRSEIVRNTASYNAGGLWFNSHLPGSKTMVVVSENIISDNTGPTLNGGALGGASSNGGWTSISMMGNSVLRNQAGFCGGLSFYGWGSGGKLDVELINNLIAQNVGTEMFGGISFTVDRGTIGTIEITNNTVADNWAANTAGGIYVSSDDQNSSATCMLRNNIVWGNTCKLPNQSGISLYSGQSTLRVEALYNIFESVLINGPVNYLPNNTEQVDPLFIDIQNGDYRLSESSPAIDGGDPAEIYCDASIPPGQGTKRGDLGAYGGPTNNYIAF
jgi:hypothetical protein